MDKEIIRYPLQKHLGEFVYLNEPNKRKRSGGRCHKKSTPNKWVL